MAKKISLITALWLGLVGARTGAIAQHNPFVTMYFQNQYLANPAWAGAQAGMKLNLAYQQQANSMNGALGMQALTGEHGFGNNVGVGLRVSNSKLGLFKQTQVGATYAYHLPLNEKSKLHFGLSLGVTKERVNNGDIVGADLGDPSVNRFNDRGVTVDGDLGIAYTSGGFTLQAAAFNINESILKSNSENLADSKTLFAAISYRFTLNYGESGIGLEPKIAIRGFQGFEDIIDAGANVSFLEDKFHVFGLYHSTKNATLGASVSLKSKFTITGAYISPSSNLNSFSKGSFEGGLAFSLTQ